MSNKKRPCRICHENETILSTYRPCDSCIEGSDLRLEPCTVCSELRFNVPHAKFRCEGCHRRSQLKVYNKADNPKPKKGPIEYYETRKIPVALFNIADSVYVSDYEERVAAKILTEVENGWVWVEKENRVADFVPVGRIFKERSNDT